MPARRALTYEVKTVLCKTAVAAGTSDITDATVIDMASYQGCGVRFIYSFGAITSGAVTSCKVAQSTTDSTPDADGTADVEGSSITVADTDDDTIVIQDIPMPTYRYLRPWVDRGTQNAVLNCIIAEIYGTRKGPVTADATVSHQEVHVSPAVGTA